MKNVMNKQPQLDCVYMRVPSSNFLGLTVPERSATNFLMFEHWKKNEEIKKRIRAVV